MFKTKGTYIFDSFGAEWFKRYFNDTIIQYGQISVAELFDNPLLLGTVIRSDDNGSQEDADKFINYSYRRYGWITPISTTKMFKIQESRRGDFEYVLNLPDYKEL